MSSNHITHLCTFSLTSCAAQCALTVTSIKSTYVAILFHLSSVGTSWQLCIVVSIFIIVSVPE